MRSAFPSAIVDSLLYCTVRYVLYFLHPQLAMRRFYYGPHFGISTEAICYTQVQCYPEESGSPEKTSLFSIDAQICCEPPGLVLRTQEILSVSGHKRHLLYCNPDRQCEKWHEPPLAMYFCLHVPRRELASLIKPIVEANRAGEKAPFSTYTCGRCDADFHIEICEYETEAALIITKWFNVGAGLSPDDPRWTRHIGLVDHFHTGNVRPSLCDGKTSARVCFENASPRSLEDLRSCNLSYLKNDRYKKVMYRSWSSAL